MVQISVHVYSSEDFDLDDDLENLLTPSSALGQELCNELDAIVRRFLWDNFGVEKSNKFDMEWNIY